MLGGSERIDCRRKHAVQTLDCARVCVRAWEHRRQRTDEHAQNPPNVGRAPRQSKPEMAEGCPCLLATCHTAMPSPQNLNCEFHKARVVAFRVATSPRAKRSGDRRQTAREKQQFCKNHANHFFLRTRRTVKMQTEPNRGPPGIARVDVVSFCLFGRKGTLRTTVGQDRVGASPAGARDRADRSPHPPRRLKGGHVYQN